ncbi:MAG: hypothetical protein JNJ54_21820 [Myxococcaceae bacterium]|nr:hypothetical protein [Myxococcaceae bacterium]
MPFLTLVPTPRWWVAVLTVALTACAKKDAGGGGGPTPGGPKTIRQSIEKPARMTSLGTRKLEGVAIDLRAAPDGRVVTALLDAEKPRIDGVPPTMRVGALWAVPTGEGAAVKIANGATNVPGGLLFTSDGKFLLVLGAYDPSQQAGELLVQDLTDLSKERQRLAPHVTYMKPSADGTRLAWVDDGVLFEGPLPAGPFRQLAGEVATAEFAPNGKHLYFRRRSVAGGGVFQLELAADKPTPKRFVDAVGEYAISEDSKWVIAMARTNPRMFGFELFVADAATLKVVKLGDDVMRFAISRDGQWVARMQVPKNVSANAAAANDLQLGELWLGRTGQADARKVGDKVREFEFTKDSKKLIFRDNYQVLALLGGKYDEKVGDLTTVTLPDGAPKVLQKRSPNYELSPDGKAIAYTARIEKPEYSRHLFLLKEGGEPVKLQEWLYDYVFAPQGDRLFFRATCTREGRSCDLLVQDLTKVGAEPPRRVTQNTFNFKLSDDGSRALSTTPHMTDEYFDVVLTDLGTGESKVLDQYVTQPVHFLAKDGSKLAWIVAEKKTAGVYVGP